MLFFIKSMGVFLVVASFSFAGFLKAASLRARSKKLLLFCDGLHLLKEYIEIGSETLQETMEKSFRKCEFIKIQNSNIFCNDKDLSAQDNAAINEFFSSIGFSAKKTECEKINNFMLNIGERFEEAKNVAAQKCKIYQTFGVCIGLVVGIFLV